MQCLEFELKGNKAATLRVNFDFTGFLQTVKIVYHLMAKRRNSQKSPHRRLIDRFQTYMGTSGHHNGHFDINITQPSVCLNRDLQSISRV